MTDGLVESMMTGFVSFPPFLCEHRLTFLILCTVRTRQLFVVAIVYTIFQILGHWNGKGQRTYRSCRHSTKQFKDRENIFTRRLRPQAERWNFKMLLRRKDLQRRGLTIGL